MHVNCCVPYAATKLDVSIAVIAELVIPKLAAISPWTGAGIEDDTGLMNA